jgi:ADP-ribose pyrophosphatase YjhB (NUDIX family)
MEKIVKIATVIENNDGTRALLIKEKYPKKDKPYWNVIKGTYDNAGESVEEAAVRECREEASVRVRIVGSLGVYRSEEDGKIRKQHNFIAKIIGGEPKIASREEQESRNEDISEVRWLSREKLIQMRPEEFISPKIYQLVQDWLIKFNN